MVTAAVKTSFAHTEPDAVAEQWDQVADTFADSFSEVNTMMYEAKTDVPAFTAFPRALPEDLAQHPDRAPEQGN